MTGCFDSWDFLPYVTAIPVREGVQPKGAVVLMAGGSYQFRGNYTDALDVARAVRFIRHNADAYGIDLDAIAVMGFSAGGIQAGEFLMHYDEMVKGTALDSRYVPDALDAIPAHASAAGRIVLDGWSHSFGSDGGWAAPMRPGWTLFLRRKETNNESTANQRKSSRKGLHLYRTDRTDAHAGIKRH